MKIRSMCVDDFEPLIQCWHNEPGIGLNYCDTREGIESYLERNPHLSVIAEHRGAVVGSLLCGHDGRFGYVHHMWTAPSWRRKGLAHTIFQQAMQNLEEIDIYKAYLFVQQRNNDALVFWSTIGCDKRVDMQLFTYTSDKLALAHK